MKHLGTERYYGGRRWGWYEYSYYGDGDVIEERTLTGDRRSWFITRYRGVTPVMMGEFIKKLAPLAGVERKSARGHDELKRVIHYLPWDDGYVDLNDIDKPDRRIIWAGGGRVVTGRVNVAGD